MYVYASSRDSNDEEAVTRVSMQPFNDTTPSKALHLRFQQETRGGYTGVVGTHAELFELHRQLGLFLDSSKGVPEAPVVVYVVAPGRG